MNANWRSLFTHLLYFRLHVRLHTNTGLSAYSGKLKTHAVKYSETAGAQSEATVGQKNRQDDLQQGQTLSGRLCEHLSDCVSVALLCVHARVSIKVCVNKCYRYCVTGSQSSDKNYSPSLLDETVGLSCLMRNKGKCPKKKIIFQVHFMYEF